MYKNLNTGLIGISGRQSELIELALTYGFRGIDFDLSDLVKRSQRGSFESAARFLTSGKLKLSGFEAPIDLDSDDDAFKVQLEALANAAEVAKRVGAMTALLRIPPATDRLPFHEFFSVIQKRIDLIAGVFAKQEVQVALYFSALPSNLVGKQFKFVSDVESFLALFKSCNAKNLGIIFDSWNWQIGGGAADQFNELPVARVLGIRLADLVEDVNLKEVSHKERLLPGSNGTVDNVRYIKHLAQAGYKGPVTAMGYAPNTSTTRDSSVALAQDALDKVLEEAGVPSQKRKPEMFAEAAYSSYRSDDRE
jgi:sugar phosphate isomerase/epimerase